MDIVNTNNAPAAIGPYSQAIIIDNKVYTSGQIPIEPTTNALVEGGIVEQTKQVIRNLQAVLKAAGSDLNKAVKVTVFLTDMNNFETVNQIYAQHFSSPYPARSVIEVSALPKGSLIEIELVASIY
jgi:2-iminobutanoate/2-iminopropanoate deaminase